MKSFQPAISLEAFSHAQLIEYAATLEGRVLELEKAVGLQGERVRFCYLTTSEEKLFWVLFSHVGVARREHIFNVVWGNLLPDDQPDIKLIDVHMVRIRKKLAVFGIKIETVWGRGYMISTESRARFQELQERAPPNTAPADLLGFGCRRQERLRAKA